MAQRKSRKGMRDFRAFEMHAVERHTGRLYFLEAGKGT